MVTIFVSIVILVSCGGSGEWFSFDEVCFVNGFPSTYAVESPETLDVAAIGIQGIRVLEDMIIISSADSSGCLSAFTKDGERISGPFLNRGRGPGEVLFQPFMSWINICYDDRHSVKADTYDYKGNYLEYNVTEILGSGRLSYTCLADSLPSGGGARYVRAGDSLLVRRCVKADGDGFERTIVTLEGEEACPAPMQYLNAFSSSDKNVLSTNILCNPGNGIIAELGSRLSVVHVYSLSDDMARTVLLKKEEIGQTARMDEEEMPKAYFEGRSYEDFFVGLYIGSSMGSFDEGTYNLPCLHFFDWDGNPLASLNLPVRSLYFDIDVHEKKLYVVEDRSEMLLKYDIADFLDEFLAVRE